MWNNGASENRLLILALDSGSGHRVRMERLKLLLESRGINCSLKLIDGEQPLQKTVVQKMLEQEAWAFIILDARDTDPLLCSTRAPVLAIDNQHEKRLEYERDHPIFFYDTLPRPQLDDDFDRISRQILFDDDVIDRARRPRPLPGPGRSRITFYAGPENFLPRYIVEGIDRLMLAADSVLYTRIGGRRGELFTIPYMTRSRYLDLLLDTDILLTYPGMSFWESLLLGAHPVLIEAMSPVHDSLSAYLSRRTGARWIKGEERRTLTVGEMILDAMTRSLSLDLDAWKGDVLERPGLRRLAHTVEEFLHDIGKSPR